jgi:hypothetical protein
MRWPDPELPGVGTIASSIKWMGFGSAPTYIIVKIWLSYRWILLFVFAVRAARVRQAVPPREGRSVGAADNNYINGKLYRAAHHIKRITRDAVGRGEAARLTMKTAKRSLHAHTVARGRLVARHLKCITVFITVLKGAMPRSRCRTREEHGGAGGMRGFTKRSPVRHFITISSH